MKFCLITEWWWYMKRGCAVLTHPLNLLLEMIYLQISAILFLSASPRRLTAITLRLASTK